MQMVSISAPSSGIKAGKTQKEADSSRKNGKVNTLRS